MKQCTSCGAWAQPNDQFCLQCGAMLRDTTSPIARVKKACGSPLLLVASILFTLYLLINITSIVLSWINNPMSSLYAINALFYQAGMGELIAYSDMEFFTILIGLFQVLGLIVPVLMTAGLWAFYIACKKKPAEAPAKTAGLTMLKVGPVLSLIGAFAGAFFSGLFAVLFFFGALSTSETEVLIVAIATLIVCVVFVLMIVYYFAVLRTIGAVQYAIRHGKRDKKISMMVIILNFFFTLYNLGVVALNVIGMNYLGAASLLCYTVSIVLLLVSTLMYRAKAQKMLEPAVMSAEDVPVYTAPQPQPQYQAPAPVYAAPTQPAYQPPQYTQQPGYQPQQNYNPYNQQNTYNPYNPQPQVQPTQEFAFEPPVLEPQQPEIYTPGDELPAGPEITDN